jgi:transcriptional regulator with XRE-family HTH domain
MSTQEIKGSSLKELREACGLSQYGLAQLVRISRNRLSLAECGYIVLDSEEQETIHSALLALSEKKAAQLRVLSHREGMEGVAVAV